jgi:hypothetical protein
MPGMRMQGKALKRETLEIKLVSVISTFVYGVYVFLFVFILLSFPMKSRGHHSIHCEKTVCRVLISLSEPRSWYNVWSVAFVPWNLSVFRAHNRARHRCAHMCLRAMVRVNVCVHSYGVRVRSIWGLVGLFWVRIGVRLMVRMNFEVSECVDSKNTPQLWSDRCIFLGSLASGYVYTYV